MEKTSILPGDTSTQRVGMFIFGWDLDFRTLRGNTKQRRWRETRWKKTPLRPKLQMEKQVGNPGSISLGCFLFHLVWGAKLEDASQVRIRLFGMFEKHVFVYLYYIYICIRLYLHFPLIYPDIVWWAGWVGWRTIMKSFARFKFVLGLRSSDSG